MKDLEEQRAKDRKYYHEHKEEIGNYQRKYYAEHLVQKRARSHELYTMNKSRRLENGYVSELKLKVEVLTHYGAGRCACIICGEDRVQCLSVDHLNGGGSKHRKELKKSGTHFYTWLRTNNFPEGYQTLCMNCQFDKEYQLRKDKRENNK